MEQGKTSINGPHQGAWVTTQKGEDWFFHFQDKEAYGRVVHLNPMKWVNDWPVIGSDADGDGIGNPVSTYKKPDVGKTYPIQTPAESDEFNAPGLGLQWQWQANPKSTWAFAHASKGALRLYSDKLPDSARNLFEAPNVLLQKFPADEFMITTKITFTRNPKLENEKAGLTIMGFSYANVAIRTSKDGYTLVHTLCKDAVKGKQEVEKIIMKMNDSTAYLRVKVTKGGKCQFSYSLDGNKFTNTGDEFTAEVARWKGAKVGLFCTRQSQTNDSGFADFDWFRVEPVQ
jgi:beta-xylosidase